MIIGYARVSTRDIEQIGALEQQKDRLGKSGAERLLVDIESGTKDSRPNYQRLQELIKQQGDRLTVVVTRLDRLTRSLVELRRFIALIEKTGTKLIALDDHIDLTTSAGKFQLNMLGALAEMESDRLGERIRHGHAYSRNQGNPPPGRPPFGYVRNGDRLEPDHEKVICFEGKEWSRWELGRLRIDLILEVGSLYQAVKQYNQRLGLTLIKPGKVKGKLRISQQGLAPWLTNPVLRGKIAWGRGKNWRQNEDNLQITDGNFPAMMEQTEYDRIRQILVRNNKKAGNAGSGRFIYSGLIRCGCCGGSYGARQWSNTKAYYCRKGVTGLCPNSKGIRENELTAVVIDQLKAKAQELWSLEQPSPTKQIDPEQTQLQQQITALKAIVPSSPLIDSTILAMERQLLMAQQQQTNQAIETHQRRQEIIEAFQADGFWEWLEERKPQELKNVFRRYVAAIVICQNQIEIKLKI